MNIADARRPNEIIYLDQPEKVSMADSWFDYGTANHFWVRHRNAVLDRNFGKALRRADQVGEIGCGSGLILNYIAQRYGKAVDGFELNLHALQQCPPLPGQLHIYNIFSRHPSFIEKYDLLMLMDVIEHIEDEVEFLITVGQHLRPNGHVLIGVPMRQHLYSAYDKADGHYRRYSQERLKSITLASGFEIEQFIQWGHAYLPLLLLRKFMLKNVSGDDAIRQGFSISPAANVLLSGLRLLDIFPTFGWTGASGMLMARKSE
ncbi:MAG: class I SAM-dependent methyltransferase [Synechococcales cyanobacterium RM1_1_8]|nr:class I SAM-dependent methyltransferase [Synechococcales cyanobacterium RM1_1_8]